MRARGRRERIAQRALQRRQKGTPAEENGIRSARSIVLARCRSPRPPTLLSHRPVHFLQHISAGNPASVGVIITVHLGCIIFGLREEERKELKETKK